jgi:hypothetical protein
MNNTEATASETLGMKCVMTYAVGALVLVHNALTENSTKVESASKQSAEFTEFEEGIVKVYQEFIESLGIEIVREKCNQVCI